MFLSVPIDVDAKTLKTLYYSSSFDSYSNPWNIDMKVFRSHINLS